MHAANCFRYLKIWYGQFSLKDPGRLFSSIWICNKVCFTKSRKWALTSISEWWRGCWRTSLLEICVRVAGNFWRVRKVSKNECWFHNVCLSVCRSGRIWCPHWADTHEILHWRGKGWFLKSVEKIFVWFESGKNKRPFTRKRTYIYDSFCCCYYHGFFL